MHLYIRYCEKLSSQFFLNIALEEPELLFLIQVFSRTLKGLFFHSYSLENSSVWDGNTEIFTVFKNIYDLHNFTLVLD